MARRSENASARAPTHARTHARTYVLTLTGTYGKNGRDAIEKERCADTTGIVLSFQC